MISRVALAVILAAALGLLQGCRSKVEERSSHLANGLETQVLSSPKSDTIAVLAYLRVGSDDDPPNRSGMAHLVAHLLAGRHTAPLAEEDRSGPDFTVAGALVAPEKVDAELDALASELSTFPFTDAELEREKARLLEELAKMRGGDPSQGAMNFAAESLRPSPGEGFRGGVADQVKAITLAELKAFWDSAYKANNARIVVVGKGPFDEWQPKLDRAFAKLPSGAPPTKRAAADSKVIGTLVMGDSPTAAALAVAAPSPSEPLYPAFLLLAARLSREAAVSHGFSESFDPLARPELLFVSGPLQSMERPDDAAARLRKAAQKVVDSPLTSADLDAALAQFGAALGLRPLDAKACAEDPLRHAFAAARRAELKLDGKALAAALKATTDTQRSEAAKRFSAQESVAVVAGGTIR